MEGKISESEVKARAYEILYHEYRGLFEQISFHARNQTEHATEDGKRKALSDIGNINRYVSMGFLHDGELRLIKTLEYCLGERNSLD